MKSLTTGQKNALIQSGFWLLLFLVFLLDQLWYSDAGDAFFDAVMMVTWIAIGAYFNLHVLAPKLFDAKRYFWYVAAVIATGVVCSSLDYIVTCFYYEEYEEEASWSYYVVSSIPYYFLILGFTTYYRLSWKRLNEKQVQTEILNQKLEAELNFLKAQVNPHFLFNTLNNIYAFAIIGHENTAPMIAKLAEILRYLIYDGTSTLVPLEKEITNLENLLDLYQIKNSKQQHITLTHTGVKSRHMIAPLLLINLLENAFKHGDALSNPSGFVRTAIEVEENRLYFSVENSFSKEIHKGRAEAGVGLENISRQLELQYPKRHQLEVTTKEDYYQVHLEIHLDQKEAYAIPGYDRR